MSRKNWLLLASLMLALSVFLAACSGDKDKDDGKKDDPGTSTEDEGKDDGDDGEEEEDASGELEFPLETSNKGEALEDGEFNYALVADTPFEGTLNRVFYSGAPDAEIMSFFDESLLATDENYLITNDADGAATYEISEDNKSITVKIKDGVKWHDGEPVKASDLLYAYELLGHPDYTGNRYSFPVNHVEGMDAYKQGEAETISGIEVSEDDTEITLTFLEATPSLLSGVWTAPVPRHYLGDVTTGEVTIEDIVTSDKIRTTPIGFGPYKVVKVVPGDSVQFERYEDYHRGKPGFESVVLKVYSTSSIVKAVKSGEVDYASIPADQYLNVKDLSNIELLAKVDLAYTYIGFKLGKWDDEKKESVTDPDAKLADKRVRQAMWHAMDNEVIGEEMYHGLRFPATTLIVPVFEFHDEDNPGRGYDPDKANELLDEAGFTERDAEGFRLDPDGNEFKLTFASMSGGETAEPIAEWYIQNWADVGIKVELLDGRLHEFNSFYDRVEADEPEIDIYQGAWGTGSDPDPSGLYGRTASFNYSRFTSDKNDELLAAGTSEKAFDTDYRVQVYKEWQELMVEEVPVAPTVYRYVLTAVNKHVTNVSIEPGADNARVWKWGVTEDKAIVD